MLINIYASFFRLEPLSAGNSSIKNAPSSTAHTTGHNSLTSQVLLKGSNTSDMIQGTPSKDDKRPTTFQLAGSRLSLLQYLMFFVLEMLRERGLNYFPECRVSKVGTRSPKSDLLLDKDSVELSGSKGSPVRTHKIPNSFVEGKAALLSPSIRQKMPKVLFSFCAVLYLQTHFILCLSLFPSLLYPNCLLLKVAIHIIAKSYIL